jgi:carnitine 3-dehydrogenase
MIEPVAVLGAGEVGAGWAALVAAHGRAVTLHDPDGTALAAGVASVHERVARLLDAGLAQPGSAERGLAAMRSAPAVAEAVAGAAMIIEAAPESLDTKRAVLAAAESASASLTTGPILVSSSSGLHASAMATALRHPERLLVAHPLVPVELIPVVELIPGPATDASTVRAAREELIALGRSPIVLRREVAGNAVGRIAAAVWRECIDLVLDGTLDARDMDRLVAGGPCLGWAAGGPHLTYELAADGGLRAFLEHLTPTFEAWWKSLSARRSLDPTERARLAALVSAAYGQSRHELRDQRDERLLALVRALRATEPRSGMRAPH